MQTEGARAPSRRSGTYIYRQPSDRDGEAVWRLIASCPPLDENSLYCNLLQCTHFADTCIVAEVDGELRGWVSGYRPPDEQDTLFVWQVAVHRKARGEGLGKKLIRRLAERVRKHGVTRIRTTITPDNRASWAMFSSVAKALDAPLVEEEWFRRDHHFGGRHDTEHLVTIGPFGSSPTS